MSEHIIQQPAPAVEQPAAPKTDVQPPAQPEASAAPKDERLEQLERREKALRKQARELQAQKQAMEAEKAKLLDANSWKQKFLEDPTAVGLSYEDIANRYLKQPTPEEQTIAALKREIEELRGGQSTIQQKLQESEVKAYESAKKQIASEVEQLVNSNPDFSLVKASNASDAVTALIEQVYRDEGVLMRVEEAVKEVEDYLLEQALSLAKLEKVQAKIRPEEPSKAAQQSTGQTPKTLTHSMTQASSTQPSNRRERAIAAFMGQLK